MRLLKLFLVAVLALAFQLGLAQSQPEEPLSANDPSKIVTIFPNPATATDFINVKLHQFRSDKVKLTLHNIIGNQLDIETEIVDEHEIRVRIKDLASGYYLLAVKEDASKFRGTFKFVKR